MRILSPVAEGRPGRDTTRGEREDPVGMAGLAHGGDFARFALVLAAIHALDNWALSDALTVATGGQPLPSRLSAVSSVSSRRVLASM